MPGPHQRNPENNNFLSGGVRLVNATQSDATNETNGPSRGILVDAAGDIEIVTEYGDVALLSNLAIGVIHPIRVKRVNATATTIADADIFLVY